MAAESVMDFFQAQGFEEIDIEDGLTALAVEFAADGSYALITDDGGTLPEHLNRFLIFAAYSAEGAYQWSTGFKNAAAFQAVWDKGETLAEKYDLVRQFAESKGAE